MRVGLVQRHPVNQIAADGNINLEPPVQVALSLGMEVHISFMQFLQAVMSHMEFGVKFIRGPAAKDSILQLPIALHFWHFAPKRVQFWALQVCFLGFSISGKPTAVRRGKDTLRAVKSTQTFLTTVFSLSVGSGIMILCYFVACGWVNLGRG